MQSPRALMIDVSERLLNIAGDGDEEMDYGFPVGFAYQS